MLFKFVLALLALAALAVANPLAVLRPQEGIEINVPRRGQLIDRSPQLINFGAIDIPTIIVVD